MKRDIKKHQRTSKHPLTENEYYDKLAREHEEQDALDNLVPQE